MKARRIRKTYTMSGAVSPFASTTSKFLRSLVLDAYGVSLDEFLGTGRMPRVVDARGAFVWLCRRRTNLSFPDIARMMKPDGDPYNHSTAITAYRRAAAKVVDDQDFAAQVSAISGSFDRERAAMVSADVAVKPYDLEGG